MITSSMISAARDEFEKIAEEERESGSEQTNRGLKQLIGSAALFAGSRLGLDGMAKRNIAEDAALAQKMRDAASKEALILTVPGNNSSFSYHPVLRRPFVAIGHELENSPGVLAHNLGHMEISQNPAGRLLQNKWTIHAGNAAPGIGLVSGALSGLSDDERVQALGRWAPVIAAAPQLAYEGGASLLGLRRMAQHGATGRQLLRGVGTLLPLWGLHAVNAGLGYGSANTTQGLVRHVRKNIKMKEKD